MRRRKGGTYLDGRESDNDGDDEVEGGSKRIRGLREGGEADEEENVDEDQKNTLEEVGDYLEAQVTDSRCGVRSAKEEEKKRRREGGGGGRGKGGRESFLTKPGNEILFCLIALSILSAVKTATKREGIPSFPLIHHVWS